MIVLWLLVAHLVGDYLFQTRWQANGKFGWTWNAASLRLNHCYVYALPFVAVGWAYGGNDYGTLAFLLLLIGFHFITDAQRFTRTPGEWLVWRTMSRDRQLEEQEAWISPQSKIPVRDSGVGRMLMPPNPWPTIGLAIDQSLHLIQIAVLAQIFLVPS